MTIAKAAVANAEASIKAARAAVDEAEAIVNFYTVKAPIDCQIMQINVHPGEFAPQISKLTQPHSKW